MLTRVVRKIKTKQLNSKQIKDSVRSFVLLYFKTVRPSYLSAGLTDSDLTAVDASTQELLRCTQRSTLVRLYVECLKQLRADLAELELKIIRPRLTNGAKTQEDKRYLQIVETLGKIVPDAVPSYEQALMDLHDNTRKSWRGTAVELRETLRETLDILAPDENVKAQPGFKLEAGTTAPTMKQKAVFILKTRRATSKQIKGFTDAVDVVEEAIGKFIRSVYDRSSAGTHTSVSRDEALRIRDYVSLALAELLEIRV